MAFSLLVALLILVAVVESKVSFRGRLLSQSVTRATLEAMIVDELELYPSCKAAWTDANGNLSQELEALVNSCRPPTSLALSAKSSSGDTYEYESPRDQLAANWSVMESWYRAQELRTFMSPVGRPGSRGTLDVSITYMTVKHNTASQGALLISVGKGESIVSYTELLYELAVKQGFSPIYIIAHRGQGESDRLLDDPFKQHVEESTDYIRDFRAFVSLVMAELEESDMDKDKPRYLLCHSMGCAVALSYIIEEYEAQRPQQFHAVVANAPLIKADTSPFPYGVATAIGEIMVALGLGENYAPTKEASFEESYSLSNFESNMVSHSFTRWRKSTENCIDMKSENFGYPAPTHKGLCNGGLTGRFAKEFLDLYKDTFQAFMKVDGKAVAPPIHIQISGDAETDGYVMNKESQEFCKKQSRCTVSHFPEAKHQSLKEIDSIRNVAINEVVDFFNKHKNDLVPQNPLPDHVKLDGEGCNSDLECASRYCDAHFGFDIFGGVCRSQDTLVSAALGPTLPRFGLSLFVVAVVCMCSRI